MDLSIIIPFHNEEKNAAAVIDEAKTQHPDAEIIAVDDGSTDDTGTVLGEQANIRLISLPRCIGQSGALYRGLIEARGKVLVIVDGDGQSSFNDIPRLLTHLPEYDFVNGYRAHRRDSLPRRTASHVANRIRNWVTRDGMKDTGGSPKIMKRECVAHLAPVDIMHRFIPALLANAGFRTIEVPVEHRERQHGRTHYGYWKRGLQGIWDLIGIHWFLARRIDTRGWPVAQMPEASPEGREESFSPLNSSTPRPVRTR